MIRYPSGRDAAARSWREASPDQRSIHQKDGSRSLQIEINALDDVAGIMLRYIREYPLRNAQKPSNGLLSFQVISLPLKPSKANTGKSDTIASEITTVGKHTKVSSLGSFTSLKYIHNAYKIFLFKYRQCVYNKSIMFSL